MDLIGNLHKMIEGDLDRYDEGEREVFLLLKYVPEVGMVVPFNWVDNFPDWREKFEKFMYGQTVCHAGIYPGDVSKFLRILRREIEKQLLDEKIDYPEGSK
jgi:hypothetical protein